MNHLKIASRSLKTMFVAAVCAVGLSSHAQQLLLQEGFNTDGEAATPKRYTTTGRNVYEVPRIQSELGNYDQKGPIYWAHNFNVSFAGNPDIPARRMIFAWRTASGGGAASPDLAKLFLSSVKWMLDNKTNNATIVVHPNVAAINELGTELTAAGYNVVDDDSAGFPDEQDVPGDLFIHGPGASNASRFAMVPKPVIIMNEPDYDDMIVSSIGTLATFDPGDITIAATNHPAAGGKTGTFTGFNAPAQPFGLVGVFKAPGATTLATVTRTVAPAINNLADVDAVIAGTKQHVLTTNVASDLDFSDASGGNWSVNSPIPGDYTGNWGLRLRGKISVQAPGTYRFAAGSDDGVRFQIDRDRNGFTASDNVVEDAGPHGHQVVYGNATFTAAGTYDFEVRSYNSGGGGSLEISVANVPVPVPDDALDSGYWENLSVSGISAIKLSGDAAVTAYRASGPNVQVQEPLIVLLNGPKDTPPGSFYDGGAFTGFEGTGFFGAAGLNKFDTGVAIKTLRLQPVSVAGKTNVKVTIALAATVVDFETSDLLDVVVYPNGANSTPVTLAHFRGVANAIQPWLADEKENYVRRLTKQFTDFTYDVPAGATDLIIEIQALTTWWTEIAAFDNIRVTAGAAVTPTIQISRTGGNVQITYTGKLESASSVTGPWTAVPGATSPYAIPPGQLTGIRFFRASN